jgi:hypothetical protein
MSVSVPQYEAALADLNARGVQAPAAGSADELAAVERFKAFFARLGGADLKAAVERTYAPALYFNDTLKSHVSRDTLAPYLHEAAEAVDECTVEVLDVVRYGEDFYVRWRMAIRFKKFKRGVLTQSVGISHIRFNPEGLIVLHQDFWDSTSGMFDHVPVIGWLIGKIKARL